MLKDYYHKFHIPVMGTGFSVDTPIKVAPLGITSVISIVDDLLLEKIRRYYAQKFNLEYRSIPRTAEDGRAKRITAYLEVVKEIVSRKFEEIKNQPFFVSNDKARYFELLPDDHFLKKAYLTLLSLTDEHQIRKLAKELTEKMRPGSIDVNIMVKVDRLTYNKNGEPRGEEHTDAKSALRGYANSSLESAVVFSAGINQSLYNYVANFRDFYRDEYGKIKKKIIIKVSNFKSALIQGKYLARKGLEVHEFRIESGLNCGGHAFASNGELLPVILQEFLEKRDRLVREFKPLIEKFYRKMGWGSADAAYQEQPLITVQGGIGTNGEMRRLIEDFGVDMTGWASPFLLVPEVTRVDTPTRKLLAEGKEEDFYLSEISPLGVPFNTIRGTSSQQMIQEKYRQGKPGSSCPKGFLQANTEYTERPICTASTEYQKKKLAEIEALHLPPAEKEKRVQGIINKTCLCVELGTSALVDMGLARRDRVAQTICPGPNTAYFNREYSLKEMVDHIYGRIKSLVPENRPHMFAKEIILYVDYFKKLIENSQFSVSEIRTLKTFKENLIQGMNFCLEIARKKPFPGENLQSIIDVVREQRERLEQLFASIPMETSEVVA